MTRLPIPVFVIARNGVVRIPLTIKGMHDRVPEVHGIDGVLTRTRKRLQAER